MARDALLARARRVRDDERARAAREARAYDAEEVRKTVLGEALDGWLVRAGARAGFDLMVGDSVGGGAARG